MRISFSVIVLFATLCEPAVARVGDTQAEVEARYGPPIVNDHPMFGNTAIASLLDLPTERGVFAAMDLNLAKAELISSPYRGQALSLLGVNTNVDPNQTVSPEVLADAKELSQGAKRTFIPKVYRFQDYLIQVFYFSTRKGTFSISEAYYEFIEDKSAAPKVVHSDNNHSSKILEWFKLGGYSYRINSAKISKIVIGPNDLDNQIATAVQDMAELELTSQPKVDETDFGASDRGERFVIIDYDIRNEGQGPSVVLTDDFRIEDGQGRQFSPDGEVTKVLLETSDKALIAEVLQPGIERHCFQGFRLPASAITGPLTLQVPEKGVLASNSARIAILGATGSAAYVIKPIDSKALFSIMAKTSERSQLPEGLNGLVGKAEAGYYDVINSKLDQNFESSDLALNWESSARSRIFLNFTGRLIQEEEDDTGWKYDPINQTHRATPLMTVFEEAANIRQALKQAESDATKLKKTDGF